jgi:hypothetical protein
MRLEVSSLRTPGLGPSNALFSQWRVGAVVEAIAVRNPADNQLWLEIGGTRYPVRIASGDAVGPAQGERLQLRVLRDKPVLALESIVEEPDNAVSDALRRYLPKQSSPAPLLANLALLARIPSMLESLPRPIREAVSTLWQAIPTATSLTQPEGLVKALQQSGTFLESTLAASPDSEAREVLSRDLKATLIQLKQALHQHGSTSHSHVASEFAQRSPDPLPSMRGNLPPLQSATATLMAVDTVPERLAELAAQADGSLSRLRSVQLINTDHNTQAPVWLVELPLVRDQQTETIRFRFEQHAQQHTPDEQAASAWTIEAAMTLRESGGFHARVTLQGAKISVHLRAESANLVVELNTRLPELAAALRGVGLDVDRLICLHGMPAEDPSWRAAAPLLDVHA